jgi:N-acetylmuramoyl-L-alanine amidase
VDLYQGTVVVPYKFKEDIIDALFPSSYRERVSRVQLNIKKVVLDAGHGGHDPGAIGRSGLREKEINLDIARRVASLLRNEGVQVVLTRPSDKYIPLGTRVRIANDSRADIFVSIHSNANPVRSLNGFEVYYVAPSVSDSKRALFAARSSNLELEGAVFASRSPTLKAILWDMIYTCARAESIELADAICKSTDSELNVEVLGVKGARYEVLRGAQMPAVLIEVGFLSNSNEESKLRNSFYRQKIAEAIVGGITDYAQDASSMEVVKR